MKSLIKLLEAKTKGNSDIPWELDRYDNSFKLKWSASDDVSLMIFSIYPRGADNIYLSLSEYGNSPKLPDALNGRLGPYKTVDLAKSEAEKFRSIRIQQINELRKKKD